MYRQNFVDILQVLEVTKIGAAHEYDVYSPGEAIKEAAKPDSRLVFEPRPS
jgi:hypothetical protein